jgi:hypothetical protein
VYATFKSVSRRRLPEAAATAPFALAFGAAAADGNLRDRLGSALRFRQRAATLQNARPITSMTANGDEPQLPKWIGSFAKSLPQKGFGELQSSTFNALPAAIKTSTYAGFDSAQSRGPKLSN